MEKLEYIPGDIVKIEYGEAAGKIGLVTNTFLRRKGCYSLVVFIGKGFQGSSKDDWIQTYNDEVSPIPLTPEILEKNGWKRNGGQYSFTFKPYAGDKVEYIGFFIEMFKNVHDMLKYEYFQIFLESKNIYGCFYVHQLQHHLFGLGINHKMEV